MTKSLKQRNNPQIITFLVVNVSALAIAGIGWDKVSELMSSAGKGNMALVGKIIALPAAMSLLIGILSWATPKRWKETLVFWRLGVSALPSSRAFTGLATSDGRIDMRRLERRFGTLPTDPAKQTSLWYGIYRKYQKDDSVEDAHGAYLRYREMTALTVIVCVATLIIELLCNIGILPHLLAIRFLLCFACLGVEYMLLIVATRNAGTHLVTNVLAIESAAVENDVSSSSIIH